MRALTALVAVAGLIVHIGLGYRFGIVLVVVGVVAHLAAGEVARRLWRRRANRVNG